MKTYQKCIFGKHEVLDNIGFEPDVILLFISPGFVGAEECVRKLKKRYPETSITGCSTSGEIIDTRVEDNTIVLNAIQFEKTSNRLISVDVGDHESSYEAGKKLATELLGENLVHILIFSDGLSVNGADLVKGLSEAVPVSVSMTGGLAGDGSDFGSTSIVYNDKILGGSIVALGLYSKDLKVACSSVGGWDSFGIERRVTRSEQNVLYELDGKPALALYKSFLADQAKYLPGSGLLFPLNLRINEVDKPVVRTILAVDEEEQSLTFAGNIPEGSYVRLMKANVERLINGAEKSAELTQGSLDEEAEFALLISCVGRRMVLKQLVEEEVEVVREVLGERPTISGFYSYGELAPFSKNEPCRLHNQTMTITTFSESAQR